MAENYTLKIDAGADKVLQLRFKDSDGNYENLTAIQARMMFKLKYDSALPIISLTSEISGGITFEKMGRHNQVHIRHDGDTSYRCTDRHSC